MAAWGGYGYRYDQSPVRLLLCPAVRADPDPNDPAQLQAFLAQLQQVLANPGSGPVNWDLARQVAQSQLRDDPAVASPQKAAIEEALRLADLWLDPESSLAVRHPLRRGLAPGRLADQHPRRVAEALRPGRRPDDQRHGRPGARTDARHSSARCRRCSPRSAARCSAASSAPHSARSPPRCSPPATSDCPLGPAGTAALIPTNITAYGEGLEIPEDQVRLYVALREAAHQRLFGHVPWLRGHVLSAVETYARGIKVDREAVEEAVGRIDPSDPESMRDVQLEGIFSSDDSPAAEGRPAPPGDRPRPGRGLGVATWSTGPRADRLPDAVRLAETFRRRRAAGGPAEQTFAALVGLELRPRRLREATALWAALAEHRGVEGRDAVWGHPDLLPSDDDFADPEAFARPSSDTFPTSRPTR